MSVCVCVQRKGVSSSRYISHSCYPMVNICKSVSLVPILFGFATTGDAGKPHEWRYLLRFVSSGRHSHSEVTYMAAWQNHSMQLRWEMIMSSAVLRPIGHHQKHHFAPKILLLLGVKKPNTNDPNHAFLLNSVVSARCSGIKRLW